jgi:hypothetical protein
METPEAQLLLPVNNNTDEYDELPMHSASSLKEHGRASSAFAMIQKSTTGMSSRQARFLFTYTSFLGVI